MILHLLLPLDDNEVEISDVKEGLYHDDPK